MYCMLYGTFAVTLWTCYSALYIVIIIIIINWWVILEDSVPQQVVENGVGAGQPRFTRKVTIKTDVGRQVETDTAGHLAWSPGVVTCRTCFVVYLSHSVITRQQINDNSSTYLFSTCPLPFNMGMQFSSSTHCRLCEQWRLLLYTPCYPHMPIGKVWIYCLLSVCVCSYGFLHRG